MYIQSTTIESSTGKDSRDEGNSNSWNSGGYNLLGLLAAFGYEIKQQRMHVKL